MSNNKAGKEKGWKYLLLSLGAFIGLSSEAVHAYVWEPIVYGNIDFGEYTTSQMVLHWLITCLTWSAVSFLLVRAAKNRMGFDIWAKGEKMKRWQVLAAVLGIVLAIVMSYFSWDGFKVIKEFQSKGLVRFILVQSLFLWDLGFLV